MEAVVEKKETLNSSSYWLSQTWGKLKLSPKQSLPDTWTPQSNKKYLYLCNCGRTTLSSPNKVASGHTRSCGKCAYKSRSYWLSQTWGSLRLNPNQTLPEEWPSSSHINCEFLCSCGKLTRMIGFRRVSEGNDTTCGRCSYNLKEYWLSQTWGKLKLDPNQELPDEWGASSDLRLRYVCTCGRKVERYNGRITSESSCEHCDYTPRESWLKQKWGNLKLDQHQTLPKEWGPGLGKVRVICDCGHTHETSMSNLVYNYSKSCGCQKRGEGEFSPENEIRKFVTSLAPDTLSTSYKLYPKKYEVDVYVPGLKLAVEHHGLPWHSERFDKNKKDHIKFQLAKKLGIRLIQIYSDEWRDKQEIMKEMLASLIVPSKGKRIKPTFDLYFKTPPEARAFLNQHHYLGAASGCLTIVAKHGGAVVGVWVFMKREEGVILWHRACVNHQYKMWNPHNKALSLALPELRSMGFKRMVTFSDNRFHTGELYEKLGFKFEKELKPDYGYTKGGYSRVSKYALRVKAGVNEGRAAEDKGYYKIWDSGKVRWGLSL